MKHFTAAALLIAPCLPLCADPPFLPGDRLIYDLHWGFIRVGTAELVFREAALEPGGPPLLHAVFTARTQGIADTLFKVRDRIETWMEPGTNRPLLYRKKQREGKTKRDIEVCFDWDALTATHTRNGRTEAPVAISPGTQDPLSLVVAIAGSRFAEGSARALAATDGKRHVQIEIIRGQDRKIATRAGHFDAQHMEVATRELQGVFEKSPDASIELWLSRGPPSFPLKMKSEVVVGSFHGELREGVILGRRIGPDQTGAHRGTYRRRR